MYLDGVLIRSFFWLPWEREDGGIEDDGVVDFDVLFVPHRNRKHVFSSSLRKGDEKSG